MRPSICRHGLAPVVFDTETVIDDLFELLVFLDVDFAEGAVLAEEDCLKADEFQQCQEHRDDGVRGTGVSEEFGECDGAILHHHATADVVDHLADSDGVFLNVEYGATFGAFQHLAKDADEIEGVGGDVLVGSGGVAKIAHAGIGPGGLFQLAFLLEHLGGIAEALVFEEPLDQFVAGIFDFTFGSFGGRARKKHFALDMDEQRRHVNEFTRSIDVRSFEVFDVGQELGSDPGDGNVVDVDVLPADEVEQEVEGAVVDFADSDGERRAGVLFFPEVCGGFLIGRVRRWCGWRRFVRRRR